MADVADCEAALAALADRLASDAAASSTATAVPDRTLSVQAIDLDATWTARLERGRIIGLRRAEPEEPRAQIRLVGTSDALVAVLDGSLSFAQAWTSGRLRVEANPFDLIRLRGLL